MNYLADTVAVVRHLCQHPALGPRAREILRAADAGEHHIFFSAITLMELLYLSEMKRVELQLDELVEVVSSSTNYEIIPVHSEVVLAAASIDDVPELHDRVIVGTAKWLDVPILTSDRAIKQSKHVQTIW
ncbi:MAG TPA: PIN domain-containing protein [Anaerolineae bacterium]|nr:PIN domain-containing protein [Anaerolineae bacterium]